MPDSSKIVVLSNGSGECASFLIRRRRDREKFIKRAERAQYNVSLRGAPSQRDQLDWAEEWLTYSGRARW